jgi:prepilin peptidase dependent protein B
MLKKQLGVTLVELMIAGTIGLIAVSAVITIYQATATQTMRQLETAHLHSTAQGIMDLISADVRRAGYWHMSPGKDQLRNNPFQQPENRLQTGAKNGEQAESCLLFSYDLDKDSKVGVGKCPAKGCALQTDADNVEQFAFRLKNKAIQMRYAGKAFNCQQGFWQAVTDSSMSVTQFSINLTSICLNLVTSTVSCDNKIDRQNVQSADIFLTAHNVRNKDIKINLKRHIEIRNDRFVAAGDSM